MTNKSDQRSQKNKAIIVYMSETGTTMSAAKHLQEITGADIVRLLPKKAYPRDFTVLAALAKKEIAQKQHPALADLRTDLTQYKTIWLGFPTWYAQPPMLIATFFDQASLKGKTIIPFTTATTSTIEESMPFLTALGQKVGAKIESGLTADSEDEIKRFALKHQQ